jgi:hypothetical protein
VRIVVQQRGHVHNAGGSHDQAQLTADAGASAAVGGR